MTTMARQWCWRYLAWNDGWATGVWTLLFNSLMEHHPTKPAGWVPLGACGGFWKLLPRLKVVKTLPVKKLLPGGESQVGCLLLHCQSVCFTQICPEVQLWGKLWYCSGMMLYSSVSGDPGLHVIHTQALTASPLKNYLTRLGLGRWI